MAPQIDQVAPKASQKASGRLTFSGHDSLRRMIQAFHLIAFCILSYVCAQFTLASDRKGNLRTSTARRVRVLSRFSHSHIIIFPHSHTLILILSYHVSQTGGPVWRHKCLSGAIWRYLEVSWAIWSYLELSGAIRSYCYAILHILYYTILYYTILYYTIYTIL